MAEALNRDEVREYIHAIRAERDKYRDIVRRLAEVGTISLMMPEKWLAEAREIDALIHEARSL